MRDKYEDADQRKYPWACGSCTIHGSPGFCGRNMTHGIPCSKHCHGYISNNTSFRERRLLEDRGLCTGDAFTSINHAGYEPTSYPDYLWIWKCNEQGKYTECDYHDLLAGTVPSLVIGNAGVSLSIKTPEKMTTIPFDRITSIVFTIGVTSIEIYQARVQGIQEKGKNVKPVQCKLF